ncbi:MAG: hypothetical protein GC168_16240 [Candidatus Hydrogenedens sp.]|nr:hypothetical protein [Candidatus Hydrogenedens sp.]
MFGFALEDVAKFGLAAAVVFLSFVQVAWLSMFSLDMFFDTSRSTAAERGRTIFRYIAFMVTVQIGITVIYLLIVYSDV